jgi:hypothetical protein
MYYKKKYFKYKKKYLELKKKQTGGNRKHYFIFDSDISEKNKNLTLKYLFDNRGWLSKNYYFEETLDENLADSKIYFKSTDFINKKYHFADYLQNLSITDKSEDLTKVYFNLNNWNNPPKEFVCKDNRLETYRAYLIQHEFGHAIGYDHPKIPKNELELKNCNPMLQQTKYTEPYCKANPWISNYKK